MVKKKLLDITVIGDRGTFDQVNFLAGLFRVGEKEVTSVKHLADRLGSLCAGGDRIAALQIIDHGNQTGQYIGADWLALKTLPGLRADLVRLRPLFGKGAVVTMAGCKVGHAPGLLSQLSILWGGVQVRAGTAYQRPLIPGIEGGVTACDLNGCTYSGPTVFDRLDGR
ncbi:MAG: hypothetical protein H7A47_15410 [Verrucomicrobiales bacterium]|nr:hypothetical protein [Verrucomicrobiales bacterium]